MLWHGSWVPKRGELGAHAGWVLASSASSNNAECGKHSAELTISANVKQCISSWLRAIRLSCICALACLRSGLPSALEPDCRDLLQQDGWLAVAPRSFCCSLSSSAPSRAPWDAQSPPNGKRSASPKPGPRIT